MTLGTYVSVCVCVMCGIDIIDIDMYIIYIYIYINYIRYLFNLFFFYQEYIYNDMQKCIIYNQSDTLLDSGSDTIDLS